MTKDINVLQRQYDRMRDELEQVNSRHGMELAKVEAAYQERIRLVERERDAAVRDIGRLGLCTVCANNMDLKCACMGMCFGRSHFKWRGPCAENGGTE